MIKLAYYNAMIKLAYYNYKDADFFNSYHHLDHL